MMYLHVHVFSMTLRSRITTMNPLFLLNSIHETVKNWTELRSSSSMAMLSVTLN